MPISEIIKRLEALQEQLGDVELTSSIYWYLEEFYTCIWSSDE